MVWVFQTGPRVVGYNSSNSKGPVYPGEGLKKNKKTMGQTQIFCPASVIYDQISEF